MKKLIIFGMNFFLCTMIYAQKMSPQVISSAGSQHVLNSISIEWTLGEVAITTLQGSNTIITQGFHQPRYIVTNISETPSKAALISVYPNPVSNLLKMDLIFDHEKNIYVRLMDSNGKLIWNKEYTGQQITESLSLKNYPSGNYILNFSIEGEQSKQTFKIQKIN
jgi:hypothetical protein